MSSKASLRKEALEVIQAAARYSMENYFTKEWIGRTFCMYDPEYGVRHYSEPELLWWILSILDGNIPYTEFMPEFDDTPPSEGAEKLIGRIGELYEYFTATKEMDKYIVSLCNISFGLLPFRQDWLDAARVTFNGYSLNIGRDTVSAALILGIADYVYPELRDEVARSANGAQTRRRVLEILLSSSRERLCDSLKEWGYGDFRTYLKKESVLLAIRLENGYTARLDIPIEQFDRYMEALPRVLEELSSANGEFEDISFLERLHLEAEAGRFIEDTIRDEEQKKQEYVNMDGLSDGYSYSACTTSAVDTSVGQQSPSSEEEIMVVVYQVEGYADNAVDADLKDRRFRLVIPESVKSLEHSHPGFTLLEYATELEICAPYDKFEFHTFAKCPMECLEKIIFHGDSCGIIQYTFKDYYPNLREVVLPDGLSLLNSYIFQGCGFKSLTIPSRVDEMLVRSFGDCKSLERVTFKGHPSEICGAFNGCETLRVVDGEGFEIEDGLLIDTSKKTVVSFLENRRHFTIPDGIREIAPYAFDDASALESIDLPSSLERIGYHAFYGCCNLKRIRIPDGVRMLCEGCFKGCASLEKVEFPRNLVEIEPYVFFGCSSLQSPAFPEGLERIGEFAFYECWGIERIDLPDSVGSVGRNVFRGCYAKLSRIPYQIAEIGDGAFTGFKGEPDVLSPHFRLEGGAIYSEDDGTLLCTSCETHLLKIDASRVRTADLFNICDSVKGLVISGGMPKLEQLSQLSTMWLLKGELDLSLLVYPTQYEAEAWKNIQAMCALKDRRLMDGDEFFSAHEIRLP